MGEGRDPAGAKATGLLEPDADASEGSPDPGPLAPGPSTAALMAPRCWFPNGIYHKTLQTGHVAG